MKAALADQSDIATKVAGKKEETTSALTQTVPERIFGNLISPTFLLLRKSSKVCKLGPEPQLATDFT